MASGPRRLPHLMGDLAGPAPISGSPYRCEASSTGMQDTRLDRFGLRPRSLRELGTMSLDGVKPPLKPTPKG